LGFLVPSKKKAGYLHAFFDHFLGFDFLLEWKGSGSGEVPLVSCRLF
jgi:hypothetical protein